MTKHVPLVTIRDDSRTVCAECYEQWPCTFIALLEALKECADRLEPYIQHTEDLVAHMKAVRAIDRVEGP